MKKNISFLILLIFFGLSCKNKSVDNRKNKKRINVKKNIKLTSDGFWIPDHIEEIKKLKPIGPFIHLDHNVILTVYDNKSCISKDGGKTWSRYKIFGKEDKYDISSPVLIRTHNGIIILAFSNSAEKANWNWQQEIHDSPDAILPTYAIRSLDGGKSWQDLQKLHSAWTGANRDIIETRDGSIIFTSMMMRHSPGRHAVATYTSKNNGKSWHRSNIIDLGGIGNHGGVMESTLVQLKNGRLWMLLRTNWTKFWEIYSDDEGLTWKDYGATNIMASSSPGLLKRLRSGRLVLVWNRYYPEGQNEYPLKGGEGNLSEVPVSWQREELSIMFSDDEGKSWSKPKVIAKISKKHWPKDKRKWISYPYVFEEKPGKLWITTMQGNLKVKLAENDFIKK